MTTSAAAPTTTPSTSSVDAVRAQEAALEQAQHAATFQRFRRALLTGTIVWVLFSAVDVLALTTFARGVPWSALLGPRSASRCCPRSRSTARTSPALPSSWPSARTSSTRCARSSPRSATSASLRCTGIARR